MEVIGIKILDATCGFRGIWYQKNHPFVTFMDKRQGKFRNTNKTKLKNRRTWYINPDVISDWKDAPFPNNYFDMIIFDPPHMVVKKGSGESNLINHYGSLNKETYKTEVKEGVKKLFEILKPEGIFILKWCENTIKVKEILKLFPYKPLFGSNTKSKGHTANFWILFIKYIPDRDLMAFTGEQSPQIKPGGESPG